ncbi:GerAB/ArcD/ProY family transporter [Sporosarcina sp. FSL K6-3508]|uniref:GerAB/ArcD/ProY family transporter n=1 Tax=Sporosarcina sp. FSL K6-3508 TaxID=2921557 RepID=UPI003159DFED
MMMFELSKTQFFCILFFIQTGGVFISFQHYLIQDAKQNSWLVFLVIALMQYLLFLLFEKTYHALRVPTFIRWVFKIYWLLVIISGLSFIIYLLSLWTLPDTPIIVTTAIILIVSYYANYGKVTAVLNIWTIAIPVVIFIVITWLLAVPHLDWYRMAPQMDFNVVKMARAFLVATAPMIGLEFYLFLRPFVKEVRSLAGWPLFSYQMSWTFFYLATILVNQLFFGIEEIKTIPQPTLYMMKSLTLSFIERADLFYMIAWIIWSIVTVILYIFFVVMTWPADNESKRRRQNIGIHLFLLAVIGFFVSKERNEWIREIVNYLHLAIGIVLPIILILLKKGLNKWIKDSSS